MDCCLRTILFRLFGWCRLTGISMACAWLFLAQAFAVPPIITEPHPYDPDWPTVDWVMTTKCRGCHRPKEPEGRTNFSNYEALMSAVVDGDEEERVVVPGDPEASYLWEYCNWNVTADADSDLPDSPEMPPEQEDWLTQQQLEAIYRWIQNGAHQFKSPAHCQKLTELDFPSAKVCAACHPKQYKEWSMSMHSYAQHSPVFQAFNATLVERTGGTLGTFCTRCHTPIGTALGENESHPNHCRSRIAMEGITCIFCHRRATAQFKSNGRIPFTPGRLEDGCMYGPFDSDVDKELGTHKNRNTPYMKTSQFCGECHDVVSPDGLRNEEAYSEWQNSPAAKQGITCQNCHMGPIQGVPIADCDRPLGPAAIVPGIDVSEMPLRHLSDHTFSGPDYSFLPDTEFPRKLDWMYEIDYRDTDSLTPYHQATLRDLRRSNRERLEIAKKKRHQVLRNAARIHVSHPLAAKCGQHVRVRVDVESLVAGHGLPTGFSAERQVWLEVVVRDPNGKVVFSSGDLDHNGDLRDEHSHEVLTRKIPRDRHLFNLQSNFTALTHKGTERTVVVSVNRHLEPLNFLRPATEPALAYGRPSVLRLAKASLPPLRTIPQFYPVRLGKTSGEYCLTVRLRFRNLPPTLLDHIGVPHLKKQLEIVDIDKYCGTISVGGQALHRHVLRLPKLRRH